MIEDNVEMKLNENEQLVLRKFITALEEKFKDELVEVKLFGSRARGNARNDSDVDVLVIIANDDWQVCDTVYNIATDILLESDVCISPKVISRKRYKYLNETRTTFIKNIIRDGISIWNPNAVKRN